jgi:hypothetical protein
MKTKIRKAIVALLVALCFAILGTTICLDEHFYRTRPREPEPAAGRVYPQFVHHGARVFLTHTETLPLQYFWYPFMALMVLAYLLNQRWKCFPPFK